MHEFSLYFPISERLSIRARMPILIVYSYDNNLTWMVYNTYQNNIWLAHEITKCTCVNVEERREESASVGSLILFIEGCFICQMTFRLTYKIKHLQKCMNVWY